MYALEYKSSAEDFIVEDAVSEDSESENMGTNKVANDDEDTMPDDEYFKGYFTFALWGFIPPNEGNFLKYTDGCCGGDRRER